MLRPRLAPILFSRQVQPAYICLPSKWSGWQELHLRPPRSEQGRLLLTLHPEIGCQTWTRTKTNGLTDRRATLTPPGNGAADRISTCIVPFRRRMTHRFGYDSNSNWSEWQDFHLQSPGPKPGMLLLHHALFAPVCLGHTGDFISWGLREPHTLNLCPAVRIENWRTRREPHPQPSRRQRVAPLIELRVQNGGKCW